MTFKRTLNIKRGDVGGKPVTLLLCFQVPDSTRLYIDQFSVAWRVVEFTGQDHEDMTAVYNNQFFVSNPQLVSGNHVKPNQWIEISPGQKTTVHKNGSGVGFTTPVKSLGKLITAENNTGTRRNLGIGFVEGTDKAVPLLYFPNVVQGSSLKAQVTNILQAYVVSDYKEAYLLRGDIETEKPIWTIGLTQLQESTNWVFESDPESGAYSISELP